MMAFHLKGGFLLAAGVFIFSMCMEGAAMAPGKKRVEIAELQNYMQILHEGTSRLAQSRFEISSQSDRKFEGMFTDEEGNGMYFSCEDNGRGKGKLLLTTMEGESILLAVQLSQELILVSAGDETFLYSNSAVYVVPPSHLIIALSVAEGTTSFDIDVLKAHLPDIGEEEGREKLAQLMELTEFKTVFTRASQAMMNNMERRRGRIPPLSVRVLLAFIRSVTSEESCAEPDPVTDQDLVAHSSQVEACSTFDTTCPVGRCPFVQGRNRCFGMCGRRCNCWRFVCGDCCIHSGCEQHDACCARGGIRALLRCNIPFGFSCEGNFRC